MDLIPSPSAARATVAPVPHLQLEFRIARLAPEPSQEAVTLGCSPFPDISHTQEATSLSEQDFSEGGVSYFARASTMIRICSKVSTTVSASYIVNVTMS